MENYPKAEFWVDKITGMLIDFEVFEVEEILEFFNNPQELIERIEEAIKMIEEYQKSSINPLDPATENQNNIE